METQDGFIVGIYNYCDRWCERCGLSGRCRLFADAQQLEFQFASGESGPSHAEPRPRSLGAAAAGEDAGDAEPAGAASLEAFDSPARVHELPADVRALEARATAVVYRLLDWRSTALPSRDTRVTEALDVMGHFAYVVGHKVRRALDGLPCGDHVRVDSDANGSAKVALLAIDRLEDAWLRVAEARLVSVGEAEPVLRELAAVKAEIERRFPLARRFVRPGLDEPWAVAQLEQEERR